MQDRLWKDAFDIVEKAQHLPLAERQAFVESATSDPRVIDMVAELLQEQERETPPETSAPQPGERFGRYEIVAEIGKGGSGEVCSARDPDLGRLVALKFLSSELLVQGAKATERLIREAKAASALNHPNIVTVYDVARSADGARAAIAMEFVDGRGLRHYCTRGSPQPIERVLNWGCQIASALAAAHANRIVHRDLKPENMIVRKADDSIKIVDFGLARHITIGQESSRSLPAGGTIDYFSPEQVAGQKPTDASDIFAVGTILYELATGQHPFPGETPLDRLYSIGTHQPEPASSVQAGIPKEIDSLLAAMLSKQPVDRPSAAGAEQALSRALRPDTAQPRKTGPRRLPALAAAVLALAAVVVGYLGFVRQSPVDSIAVLPFRHADPSMDYLSDGLRHEIALGLALTRGLRVAGNTNIAKYKEENLDVRKSGRELGVASLLRGDLNRNGKLIQLDLELLDTKTGAQLWSGEFQQPDTGIATFSHEVSGRIAAKLVARVVVPAQMPANRNPEAYEAYLRGRYHFIRRTRQDMALAAEHAERAVQLDPKFAEAWSLLAASQGFTPGMYNSLSPQELYAKTRGAIDRAIAIDPDLPEVHLTLGGIKFFQERNWAEAEREFRRTIELNPSDSQAHLFLAILMRVLGRGPEEREFVRKARELDPLSPLVANHVAWTEHFRGDEGGAFAELQKAMALDATYSSNHTLLGYIRLRRKEFPAAIEAFQKAANTAASQASQADLGYAYGVSGDRAAALRILQELESGKKGYVPAGAIAWIYMGLGDKDATFRWFEKACDENYHWLNYINIWPVYDGLRQDPRMAGLIHRLRLDTVSSARR